LLACLALFELGNGLVERAGCICQAGFDFLLQFLSFRAIPGRLQDIF
jgi:hypothetical protein